LRETDHVNAAWCATRQSGQIDQKVFVSQQLRSFQQLITAVGKIRQGVIGDASWLEPNATRVPISITRNLRRLVLMSLSRAVTD
jgi:hypothetical protein